MPFNEKDWCWNVIYNAELKMATRVWVVDNIHGVAHDQPSENMPMSFRSVKSIRKEQIWRNLQWNDLIGELWLWYKISGNFFELLRRYNVFWILHAISKVYCICLLGRVRPGHVQDGSAVAQSLALPCVDFELSYKGSIVTNQPSQYASEANLQHTSKNQARASSWRILILPSCI